MRINLGLLLAVFAMYETIEFTDLRGEPNFVLVGEERHVVGDLSNPQTGFRWLNRWHHPAPNPRAGIPLDEIIREHAFGGALKSSLPWRGFP